MYILYKNIINRSWERSVFYFYKIKIPRKSAGLSWWGHRDSNPGRGFILVGTQGLEPWTQ